MPNARPERGAFRPHDHGACVAEALASARAACAARKLRLTRGRERVLEILLESHRALGAYEVLDRLRAEGLGSEPPIAYRALDFLVANGFVHRIEKLNAFVACAQPGDYREPRHSPCFMICRACRKVAETIAPAAAGALGRAAAEMGFDIETSTVEVEGLCPACRVSP